jgi:hypothetical protein
MLTGYRIRAFEPRDWTDLQRLHQERGFKFDIPPRLAEAIVVEDEATGQVVQIYAGRETREEYCWLDPGWATPRMRLAAFEEANALMQKVLKQKEIADSFVFVEPSLMPAFGRRLKKLGWIQHTWPVFVRKV